MSNYNCAIVLFSSTHEALRGEEELKRAGVPHTVINAPRQFKKDCGIALRLDIELREMAESALSDAGVKFDRTEPYRCRWI